MQIVKETICMRCQSLYCGSKKKIIVDLSAAEICPEGGKG